MLRVIPEPEVVVPGDDVVADQEAVGPEEVRIEAPLELAVRSASACHVPVVVDRIEVRKAVDRDLLVTEQRGRHASVVILIHTLLEGSKAATRRPIGLRGVLL